MMIEFRDKFSGRIVTVRDDQVSYAQVDSLATALHASEQWATIALAGHGGYVWERRTLDDALFQIVGKIAALATGGTLTADGYVEWGEGSASTRLARDRGQTPADRAADDAATHREAVAYVSQVRLGQGRTTKWYAQMQIKHPSGNPRRPKLIAYRDVPDALEAEATAAAIAIARMAAADSLSATDDVGED